MAEETAAIQFVADDPLGGQGPCCPSDLFEAALSDPDWEVRLSAVLRPETPFDALLKRTYEENHPLVQRALWMRLGPLQRSSSRQRHPILEDRIPRSDPLNDQTPGRCRGFPGKGHGNR